MEQSTFWEANKFPDIPEITRPFGKPKFQYSTQKRPSSVPILSYTNQMLLAISLSPRPLTMFTYIASF
jgi:hypothetical protein